LTYHGQANKGLTPQQLKEYDIVITTYQTMTQELFPFGKSEPGPTPATKGLFSVTWRRIVLDEGHQIRNPKAKMSQAACALAAKSRWILTGTPIVNNLKDLYSHVKFLRMSGGLTEFEVFNSTLIRPLKYGENNARLLLQALMSSLCLRRMKEMKFIDLKLPEITFHKYAIKFLPHEQERYDAFKSEAKGLLEAAKAKKGENNMTHLLEVLLRLRQTCNHWKMCGDERVKKLLDLMESKTVVDVMNPANRKALQDLLQLRIDSQDECCVCRDSLKNPVITACAHALCRECIERVIETQHKCPMCREYLKSTDQLVEPAAGIGEGDETDLDIDPDTTSSKIEALIKVLKASEADPSVKTIVFSQWTSFLDLVQTQCVKNGMNFTRLDGKMTSASRDAALESLHSDPSCKVMLASLAVCSVGLNLVAANQVILADSWWAPAIEDQAVDRVHRLGQTRDCKVVRLVVEGTIEDEVLEIQAKKRKLASEAFGEKDGRKKRKETRGTLGDIERLLG
jgi:SWI/SNF-related matrix-associated actin-dependent regulator of chromatin subfamily A3